MSGNFIILTIFEVIIAALLIIGLFNERKLADFEEMMFKRIKHFFCKDKGKNAPKKISSCRRIKTPSGHSRRRCA